MNITIINDCKDENAKGRQLARTQSIFKCPVNFIGANNELEASGDIIDILDANENNKGVILVNVAPRNGKGRKHLNGSPFGYFWHKKVLVVSTVDGYTLSLVKKLGITKFINILDVPETVDLLIKRGRIPKELKNHIINSQFRSYDFLPTVAHYIFKNKNIKSHKMEIEKIPNAPAAVWWVDNFGNCKTTLLDTKEYKGEMSYYSRLKDVPDGKAAIITGSSGLGDKRFLEMVIQGGNASKIVDLKSEDRIFKPKT